MSLRSLRSVSMQPITDCSRFGVPNRSWEEHVDRCDGAGCTPLHYAALKAFLAAVLLSLPWDGHVFLRCHFGALRVAGNYQDREKSTESSS